MLTLHFGVVCTLFLMQIANVFAQVGEMVTADESGLGWLFAFLKNFLGYATILIPGYLFIKYVRKSGYLENAGQRGPWYNLVKVCVQGNDPDVVIGVTGKEERAKSNLEKAVILIICASGLQVSYLTWGVLQERIMAHSYGETDSDPGETFTNSQFLVFVNRILAFMTAAIVLWYQKPPKIAIPFYKYSYCSLSNILSSWCQYEALKFVSFPTQVLAKASKVIPVMIMGKVVSGNVYEVYQYVTALLISAGMSLFLLTEGVNDRDDSTTETTFAGLVMLVGYMSFDSFTSNWQGELFKTYKMSSIQMMFGVNLFSCLFTVWSLISQGSFYSSLLFMMKYQLFFLHCVILSICSATGQLFIFQTISRFGPIVFTIIMTLRQMFAILLSCFIYSHELSLLAWTGVFVVFCALFLEIYCKDKMRRRATQNSKPKPKSPESKATRL